MHGSILERQIATYVYRDTQREYPCPCIRKYTECHVCTHSLCTSMAYTYTDVLYALASLYAILEYSMHTYT